MLQNRVNISFIIPAYNEESHIAKVIDSINSNVDGRYSYEIIVVDNGSTDHTIEIAKSKKVRTFCLPCRTISALRNFGVAKMHGDIIVFIDADVYLKDTWGDKIGSVIEKLKQDPKIITGSMYGIKDKANWIERHWFAPILKRDSHNYINAGHLLITKGFFENIGGFNEEFETGEDSELCERGKLLGATIINDTELKVVHEGYPKNVLDFFHRERWHGRGDYVSFKNMIRSKPAILSLMQMGVLIVSVVLALWFANLRFLLVYIFFMVSICTLSAYYRSKRINLSLPFCSILYSLYFVARGFSFIDVLWKRSFKKSG